MKGNLLREQQRAPLRPLVTKKIVHMVGGQNQETTETRGCSVKGMSHFVNQYQQLPEDPLLKWTIRVINLGEVYLVLNSIEKKSMFGLIPNPQHAME